MALADWIMRAATEHPPRGREQWAEAMRAEYASLDGGRLSWALGCWTAMLGWRLRADAFYLVVLIAVTYFWTFHTQEIMNVYLVANFYLDVVPRSLTDGELIHPYLALMLLVSIVLSTFKPDRVATTAVTMIVLLQVSTIVRYFEMQRDFPSLDLGPIHPFNAPYFVAVFAEIGVCFVGALIGRWIAALWRWPGRKRAGPLALGDT